MLRSDQCSLGRLDWSQIYWVDVKRQVSSDQVFEYSKYISIQVLEYSGIKVFKCSSIKNIRLRWRCKVKNIIVWIMVGDIYFKDIKVILTQCKKIFLSKYDNQAPNFSGSRDFQKTTKGVSPTFFSWAHFQSLWGKPRQSLVFCFRNKETMWTIFWMSKL